MCWKKKGKDSVDVHTCGPWKNIHAKRGTFSIVGGGEEGILVFVVSGEALFTIDVSGEFAVPEGTGFFALPGCVCVCKMAGESHIMVCSFDADHVLRTEYYHLLQKSIALGAEEDNLPVSEDFRTFEINEIMSYSLYGLDECMRQGRDSDSFMEIKRQELLHLLLLTSRAQEIVPMLNAMIGENVRFRSFVMSNYLKVQTVQELAELANYSASGFIKKFRRYFGESPYKWMSARKAECILHEIQQGTASLKSIAMKYNFSSYQHFSSFCKAHYGVPPTEITKEHLPKAVEV